MLFQSVTRGSKGRKITNSRKYSHAQYELILVNNNTYDNWDNDTVLLLQLKPQEINRFSGQLVRSRDSLNGTVFWHPMGGIWYFWANLLRLREKNVKKSTNPGRILALKVCILSYSFEILEAWHRARLFQLLRTREKYQELQLYWLLLFGNMLLLYILLETYMSRVVKFVKISSKSTTEGVSDKSTRSFSYNPKYVSYYQGSDFRY
jgi:hypothetical protein